MQFPVVADGFAVRFASGRQPRAAARSPRNANAPTSRICHPAPSD